MKKFPKWVNFFRLVSTRIRGGSAPLKEKSKKIYAKSVRVVEKRPLVSFFTLLVLLLVFIVIGNFITKPKLTEDEKDKTPIEVQTYSIGQAPRITVSAQIEKEGVIQITAQTAGIINKINVRGGQSVKKGQVLVNISTNYQGANIATAQRQLAGVQVQTTKVSYDAQKDIIAKQREIAQKTDANADELRSITKNSVDETRSLVTLNESILSSIETNIQQLEATNIGQANDALILQTKQLQSQFLSATNQARSSLRNTEFSADENKPASVLSNLQREVTVKQLDLQEKTSRLGLEAASLQLRIAQINESLSYPTSPFTGVIERVHVKNAQQVSPGAPLVTISSSTKSQTAVAYVPQNIAASVSKLNSSALVIADRKYEVIPIYISQEAVNGQLYAIILPIPEDAKDRLTDKAFVDVEIPVGYSFTSSAVPYIPLDAVHQTQDKTIVFVVKNQKADGKTVTLGQVQGEFTEITSGLNTDDIVIVSRNIVAGDPVKSKNP